MFSLCFHGAGLHAWLGRDIGIWHGLGFWVDRHTFPHLPCAPNCLSPYVPSSAVPAAACLCILLPFVLAVRICCWGCCLCALPSTPADIHTFYALTYGVSCHVPRQHSLLSGMYSACLSSSSHCLCRAGSPSPPAYYLGPLHIAASGCSGTCMPVLPCVAAAPFARMPWAYT